MNINAIKIVIDIIKRVLKYIRLLHVDGMIKSRTCVLLVKGIPTFHISSYPSI